MTTETAAGLVTDARSIAPVNYIQELGLRPEDCYGFLPVEQSDGSALVYAYRDRPEYAAAREKLGPPQRSRLLGGAVEVDRPGGVEIDIDPAMTGGVDVGGLVRDALGQAPKPDGQVAEKVVESIDASTAGPGDGAIVSHRLYPALRTRSSNKQLGHFLPRYRDAVGLRPEDVYGVFAQGIHYSGGESSAREWDAFWIVYRDRDQYAAGREAYAAEMKGDWPAPSFVKGVGDVPAIGPEGGKVEVKKSGWPKRRLVQHATAEGLAESLAENLTKLGHEPEGSFGIAPDFQQRKIFIALRKS